MKRRGMLLIEMSAVIAISAVLLGVSIVMLTAMIKNDGASRRHFELCTTYNRLDEQFRADVHAAASADPNEAGDAVEFTIPQAGKTLVRYRCLPQEIVREEIEGEKTLRRESYTMPEETKCSFERIAAGTATLIKLSIEPKPTPGTKTRYPSASIEALLAKDRRFEQRK